MHATILRGTAGPRNTRPEEAAKSYGWGQCPPVGGVAGGYLDGTPSRPVAEGAGAGHYSLFSPRCCVTQYSPAAGPSQHPSATRLLLLLLIGAVAVATVVASGVLAWRDHLDLRAHTEGELATLAGLVDEHVRVMLAANKMQLERVADVLAERDPYTVDAETLRGRLLEFVDDLPGGHSLWLFDANANLVATTLRTQATLNVADREYFTAARDGAGVFISPMIWGKLVGGHYFVMSRRLTDRAGRFVGVVQSSVDAGYVLRRWAELAPYPDTAVSVLKTGGEVVLHSPPPSPGRELKVPSQAPALRKMLDGAPIGVMPIRSLDIVGTAAKPDRIGAYRRMSDFPLVVVTSREVAAVERPWVLRSLEQGMIAAVMLVLVLTLGALVVRSAGALDRKAEQLGRTLGEKDLLFQEIHHRIKNNLQIVGSMLTMQSLLVEDGRAKAVLQEALDRIQTMGLVHQTLYQRNEARDVEVGAYLHSVVEHFRRSYAADESGVAITVRAERRVIEMDRAIPLALIVTEALTNALKHAFPDRRSGTISVTLSAEAGRSVLAIADDGVGMPPRLLGEDSASLGLRLIRSLAQQIGGRVRIEGDGGTRIVVDFSDEPDTAAVPADGPA